jgi:tetratricopeptide (TPR) repeat protein
MNRLVPVLLNGSKTLIVGLSLVFLPWLGSMYLCSRTSGNDPAANVSQFSNPAQTKAMPPHLLPEGNLAQCMLKGDSQPQPILAAEFSAPQTAHSSAKKTEQNDPADGPVLADPAQKDKSESVCISPSGIVADENFDISIGRSSPPVWKPKDTPIVEKTAEPSHVQAPLAGTANSGAGLATQVSDKQVQLPAQEADLPYKSTSMEELPPALERFEVVANSTSSADFTPAAQSTTVDDQSNIVSIDREQTYPSTERLLSKKAPANDLPIRSEQLELIARQADQQTRHGLELAGRGAYFAARSEFIAALRLVAQGLDTDEQTKIHGKSLAAGLTALKEAEDFIPGGSRMEADLDLSAIIAGHTTAVLKEADKTSLTTLTALKSYFTFAQQQFAQAAGNEVAGSMALHALGKMHEELAKGKGPGAKAAGPKAMVFYQASLLVLPQNFMASNDLGVMLARNGNYEDARKILEHCLSLQNQSTSWHNLAVVYERLGQLDKARQAQQQSFIAAQTEQARRQQMLIGASDHVRWVDESAFAQAYNPSGNLQQGVPPVPAAQGGMTMQQAGRTASPITGNRQPMPNQYWSASGNVNAGQTPQAVNRSLPSLQPATTGWIPKTQNDTWR